MGLFKEEILNNYNYGFYNLLALWERIAYSSSITCEEIAASFCVSFERMACDHVFWTHIVYQSR